MITNYKCDNCSHQMICKNKSTLDKFNPDSKKFIEYKQRLTVSKFTYSK